MKRFHRVILFLNLAGLLTTTSLNCPASARTLGELQMADDFPTVRASIVYRGWDWETDTEVTKTIQIQPPKPLPAERIAPAWPAPRRRIPAIPFDELSLSPGDAVNREDFGDFTTDQSQLLAANSFVVTANTWPQMFYVYEENVYRNLPNFVTTDVFLHTFSDLFGYALRRVESRLLYGLVKLLSEAMRKASYDQYLIASDPAVKSAARSNLIQFAVSEALFKRTSRHVPHDVEEEVEKILERINAASGEWRNPVGEQIDFSDFKPRGHYTLSEDAANYFRAMKWYGIDRLPVSDTYDLDGQGKLRAALFVLALDTAHVKDVPAWLVHDRAEELITLFTGPSNRLTPREVAECVRRVYGDGLRPDSLTDPKRIRRFSALLNELPSSRIVPNMGGVENDRAVAFFGRRYMLDADVMQRLIRWPDKVFSGSMDVLAALGFSRAGWIQENLLRIQDEAPWYPLEAEAERARIGSFSDSVWGNNLYTGALWTLAALHIPDTSGMPQFMRGAAWSDKTLNTASGSWAELRHNTLLYTEASFAEGGDGCDVPLPKGYIEPNDLFFARFSWLLKKMTADLAHAGALDERTRAKIDLLAWLSDSALAIVTKELLGEKISEDEYRFIHFIGANFAQITISCLLDLDIYGAVSEEGYDGFERILYNHLSESQKHQAVIEDVGQSGGAVLEVGVGPAHEIYVIVPSRKGPRLTRGAVYQYYEFDQPAKERLTDEQWRSLLSQGRAPSIPIWCRGYRSENIKPGEMGADAATYCTYSFEPD